MILILICLLGIFANSVNIAVFVMPKMKDSSFKYMLATSISNMFYLKLTLIGFLISCDSCTLKSSYFTQLYLILVDDYLTSVLAIFSIITDNILSIQRYLILVNNSLFQRVLHIWTLFLIFIFLGNIANR